MHWREEPDLESKLQARCWFEGGWRSYNNWFVNMASKLNVTFVASSQNLAVELTRVASKWLDLISHRSDSSPMMCATQTAQLPPEWIWNIHQRCEHLTIRRTTYFCRKICSSTTKVTVRSIEHTCEDCQSIDPAPARWEKGRIEVGNNWHRLGMDLTHYCGNGFLTLNDCGPTRSTVWRRLARQDASAIFCDRSASAEILMDNVPGFCSQTFLAFTDEWDIWMRYWSAYVPEGNGIAEQCQGTVKRIAVRTRCWYNAKPKDNETLSSAPANTIYQYKQRLKSIDPKLSPPEVRSNVYQIGKSVWVKPPDCRCTTRFYKGQFDRVISPQKVLVNGIPRYMKDLHRHDESAVTKEAESDTSSSSDMGIMVSSESDGQHSSAQLTGEEDTKVDDQTCGDRRNAGNLTEEHSTLPRIAPGEKWAPSPCHICDHEISGECNENWEENRHSPLRKRQRIYSACKICFFD